MNAGIEDFLRDLDQDHRYIRNIVATEHREARSPQYAGIPSGLRPEITRLLQDLGISSLYSHQNTAIESILNKQNTLISSGVASGKSLCYQLPILNQLLEFPASRALLLFPTKALAQDQQQNMAGLMTRLKAILPGKARFSSGVYDGDTPSDLRASLRKSTSLIFSNPDMLHLGILPHHPLWSDFFSNLRYVVIDEVHIYRGVFGSHFANVLRRLRRICGFYRIKPIFICTSATLGNALELSGNLLEDALQIIDTDGSPHGESIFHIYNPPLVDEKLGIRRSAMQESTHLAKNFIRTDCQALMFTETRRNVEILFRYLQDKIPDRELIRSYRSGYLAQDRREIERRLREGRLRIVVSTNALELGIDVGGLDAIFINGYPGTISGTRQQSGRAGRKGGKALTILVATANPLDQYICQHPEYLFENNPEQALIDPDNPEILIAQLECAIAELALLEGEAFGKLQHFQLFPYLSILLSENRIRKIAGKYVVQPGSYPSSKVSLRNMSSQFELLNEGVSIGFVDESSVRWMAHPQAIYLHEGDTWIVKKLDFELKKVELEPIVSDYYTQTLQDTQLELNDLLQVQTIPGGKKHLGKVTVTNDISGFKKIRFFTQENLGVEELDMPPSILDTVAFWISLSQASVEKIKALKLWRNQDNYYGKDWDALTRNVRQRDGFCCQHCGARESGDAHHVHHIIPFKKFTDSRLANAPENLITLCPRCHRLAEKNVIIQSGLAATAYLLHNLAPFFVMCALKDIGVHFEEHSELASGDPIIAIYDSIPGGIGLSKKLYELQDILVCEALSLAENCPCEDGCPSCTGPISENGEGAKAHAIAILKALLGSAIQQ